MKRVPSNGFRRCRSCAVKNTNIRTNCSSKGGKIGGRSTADSGKLQKYAGSVAHTPSAEKKRFNTLKRRGLLMTSKPELELKNLLVSKFGVENIEHHVIVDGFRIDFYVNIIDTYIQLDGEYWHGLNVPYKDLKGTPKEKYDRDRKCDLYFKKKNLKLIRITDKQLKNEKGGILDNVK
jgi:very-short-patch-repair endonuclease